MARPSPDGVGHPIQILLSTGGATVIDKTPACHPASLLDLRLVLTGVKVPQPSTHNRCSLVLAGKRKNANVGSPHAPRSYRGGQVCGCQGAVAARWRGYLRSPLRYATTRVGVIICQARDCCSAQAPRSPVRVCNVAAVRGLTWCHRAQQKRRVLGRSAPLAIFVCPCTPSCHPNSPPELPSRKT